MITPKSKQTNNTLNNELNSLIKSTINNKSYILDTYGNAYTCNEYEHRGFRSTRPSSNIYGNSTNKSMMSNSLNKSFFHKTSMSRQE